MAGQRGQPTKYKPEYCEALVAHMTDGCSFETFAAYCNVSIDTLYEWAKVHQEFSEAKKRAVVKSMDYWEKMGRAGTAGKLKGFNVASWIYTMKCRFPKYWRDETILIEEKPKRMLAYERKRKDVS